MWWEGWCFQRLTHRVDPNQCTFVVSKDHEVARYAKSLDTSSTRHQTFATFDVEWATRAGNQANHCICGLTCDEPTHHVLTSEGLSSQGQEEEEVHRLRWKEVAILGSRVEVGK
ncbi:hypothetical protein PV10_05361 [Exophiala mesophila]|uniref:Uncharacterized protein n=1 Tax=Exophiala mesophila TaxID=212818 RepID=A0A0D1XRK4_EXOME|nr:uncharacterized protein PV10_05361 [Exophiala mesophila]KIV90736.1 hypothetical protein PV10_05361 [Exophiala mesophila]